MSIGRFALTVVTVAVVASVLATPAVAAPLETGDDAPAPTDGVSTTQEHAEGDPPENPGNSSDDVPGVGRPDCIPPQNPGHGQPDCIPPEGPPGQGGDNPGNGNGGQASTMDHSEGSPPEDPGNNGDDVPGVGRPGCIPPQDPGHGQPDCVPPEHANNPDNADRNNGGGNGNGNGNGGGGGVATALADLLGSFL